MANVLKFDSHASGEPLGGTGADLDASMETEAAAAGGSAAAGGASYRTVPILRASVVATHKQDRFVWVETGARRIGSCSSIRRRMEAPTYR